MLHAVEHLVLAGNFEGQRNIEYSQRFPQSYDPDLQQSKVRRCHLKLQGPDAVSQVELATGCRGAIGNWRSSGFLGTSWNRSLQVVPRGSQASVHAGQAGPRRHVGRPPAQPAACPEPALDLRPPTVALSA